MSPAPWPSWLARVDRAVGAVVAGGRWLVLPIALILFVQWPLRDLVRAYSRDANDLGQWLFALYVSLAMTFAGRAQAHLAADALARRYSARTRDMIARAGAAFCVLPWSLFILVAGAPAVWLSVGQLEGFPDTYNPGYFIVKASAWILALLLFLQAALDLLRPRVPE
jgi:TRAP-type mannitol/chloroaromatic compound transport system permease small subunit